MKNSKDDAKAIALRREKAILLYAATRLSLECTTVFLYYFGASLFPPTIWVEIIKFFAFHLENLFLSPVLLVFFCRSVRDDAFPFLKDSKVVMAVTATS
uniref:7TM_GPCR_Srx domain-containing protein n=1 Tax=Steinernema glaseri TaxID=37863 RepID=A0A1I8ADI5_9BILA